MTTFWHIVAFILVWPCIGLPFYIWLDGPDYYDDAIIDTLEGQDTSWFDKGLLFYAWPGIVALLLWRLWTTDDEGEI